MSGKHKQTALHLVQKITAIINDIEAGKKQAAVVAACNYWQHCAQCNAPVFMKSLLVHPKDKQEKEEITDCIYKIPCALCKL